MNAARLNTTRKKKELDKLYELQKQDRKEAFQYIENLSGNVYRLSLLFMEVLKSTFLMIGKKNSRMNQSSKTNKKKYRIARRDNMNILT